MQGAASAGGSLAPLTARRCCPPPPQVRETRQTVVDSASGTQRTAIIKVSMAGTVTALGGLVGYTLVSEIEDFLPFFLVLASSSFAYVALADLIPQLQKKLALGSTVAQVLWLLSGVALVTVVSGLAHSH